MNATRVAVIAGVASALVAAAACSDSAQRFTAPATFNATSGIWRSTIWQPTSNGMKYVGTREGTYRIDNNGRTIADSGRDVSLNAAAIAAAAAKMETEAVLNRFSKQGGTAAMRVGDDNAMLRPELRNGRTIRLGTRDGKEYALQLAPHSASGAPPSASIITVNGKAVAYRDAQYSNVRGRWRVRHNTSTLLDSTANAKLVVDTDYGVSALSAAVASNALRVAARVVGDALVTLVQPNALHATTLDDSAYACQAELETVLKATVAWTAAGGALAGATALCATTIVACASVPFLTAAFYLADIALGSAIGNHLACMINYWRSLPSSGSGGGNSSGGSQCTVIDWYISYDSGRTWNWFGQSQECHEFAE